MNDIYSFYQLISKYQIEIPIIQRDYAHGRDNTKAADVRKSLVEKMKNAVEKEDETLFFDFVYGRIDGNKFIPFDGQQRLTSLFLFHKYVFEKCQSEYDCCHNGKCICKEILKRFSYATRQSSREFCEKLVQENVIPSDDKKVSENINNLSWFYPDWQKDPTIIGMLTMLDEIHNQMNGKKNFKVFAEKLTSGCNCPVTFHFVDMGKHKLSDETYVKMNARGKQLTPFENFKASLEQYLEEKNKKDLLSRLKGKYDESKQKYTGIDGSWLDLFWGVTNKEKQENEGKELPDSLMMSFFNRHFMNVWRRWYANNSKSINKEELDAFNSRIQDEMPLYPTKDDFVSWDIYKTVLDNCGIDECLSPIFNIWDKLYNEQEKITGDSQATWNRKKNEKRKKWILFEGTRNNKDNRETYPSRVAFYALLKYFGANEEKKETTLAQWMRVVWNIIENSTIDSSDTYQSALNLIYNMSKQCHNIYDALANHFEEFQLGSQYHAQDQVKEEIHKAQQIIDENGNFRKYTGTHKKENGDDYNFWEEIIIDAESYAFFNGAIRFLFQNEKGEVDSTIPWNTKDFDIKWANSQKYFDENGVKDDEDKYKTESILLKAVLYNIEDFWTYIEPQKYVFDNKSDTWKSNILLEKGWQRAIHQIMMGKLNINAREDDCLIYKTLYSTNLLNYVANEMPGSRIKWIHGHRAIYPPYYEGILLDDENRDNKFYRNRILSSEEFTSNQKIEELGYYTGWNITFEYNKHSFQWNTDEKVYLLENGKRKQKNENECFCVDVINLKESQELICKLNCLLVQAYPEESDKTCCNDCQDKICE